MSRGPEYERQQRITQALRTFGWLHTHFRPLRTEAGYRTPLSGDKGYVDITAVHPSRGILLLCEVKSNRGKLNAEQELWIEALEYIATPYWATSPVRVVVCDSDAIERELLALISDGRIA